MQKITSWLWALPCAMLLAGCAGPITGSHATYQFSDPDDGAVCLMAPNRGEEMFALQVRRALQKKGLKVRDVESQEASSCERCVRFEAMYSGDNRSIRMIRLELDRAGQMPFRTEMEVPTSTDRGLFSQSDDYSSEIRTLVNRIFPDPVRWTSY